MEQNIEKPTADPKNGSATVWEVGGHEADKEAAGESEYETGLQLVRNGASPLRRVD